MATTTASAVTEMSRGDEQIQRGVLAELTWDARVLPNEIGVVIGTGGGGRCPTATEVLPRAPAVARCASGGM